ncbi:MAG: GTPase [Clostridiales bacterium]|nr:GTPase [Clostridiales bacterium]MDY3747718.1 GTP-binding protein [Lachnospiraceae bacterium]
MEKPSTLVFLITGFLDSGKSTFIRDLLIGQEFTEGEKTLLILTEEGEEEFDEKELAGVNVDLVTVDSKEEFTSEFLNNCKGYYRPKYVFIEYNGMWKMDDILDMDMPEGWMLNQIVTMVDGTTFESYLANMKPLLFDIFAVSEMIFFNRCTPDMQLAMYRRSIRAVNRRVQIGFEDMEGNPIDIGKEELPYDINADVIEIADEDFGVFYVDILDEPEKYVDKMVSFKGKAYLSKEFPEGYFVPGRHAMTCCADDIQFIGFACKTKYIDKFKTNMWLQITAMVKYEYFPSYHGKGPVLYLKRAVSAQKPEEELVYFG